MYRAAVGVSRMVPAPGQNELGQLLENLDREVSAVCELKGPDAAFIAGLDNVLGDFHIIVEEDRDYSRLFHRRQGLKLSVF